MQRNDEIILQDNGSKLQKMWRTKLEFLWESSKGGFLIFGNQEVKLTFFLHLNLNFQIYENRRYL
jgi:hypothetical protein